MSQLLQQLAVALLVAGCALFTAWRLVSLRLRLAMLGALARVPGVGGTAWLARWRARLAASVWRLRRLCAPRQAGRGFAESNTWCTSPLMMRSW